MYTMPKGDILKDFDEVIVPPPVDRGVRFANYLIDYILSYIFVIIVAICLVRAFANIDPYFRYRLIDSAGGISFSGYLTFLVVRPLYFVLLEGLTKGRTVGKMVTGSVAIREDGRPLEWREVFIRSYSRIVPFEAWSALGTAPWHDKWSNTTVVYKAALMTL